MSFAIDNIMEYVSVEIAVYIEQQDLVLTHVETSYRSCMTT